MDTTFESLLEETGKIVYTNVGVSMLPWIHEGKDIIIIEKAPEVLRKYDTVLFVRSNMTGRGRYVLHRIIRCCGDDKFYIMGDNTVRGEYVTRDRIIGILTEIQQPNRIINVNDSSYRFKVRLWWLFVMPFRPTNLKLRRSFARGIRKILKISPDVRISEFLLGKKRRR